MALTIPRKRKAVKDAKNKRPTGVKYCKVNLNAVLIVDQARIDAPAYKYALFCLDIR